MLNNINEKMLKSIYSYSNWGILGIQFIRPLYEVAIVGPDWKGIRKIMDNNSLPHAVFLGGGSEGTLTLLENKLVQGQTTIYVCVDKTCKIPVTTAEQALQQMK